MKETKIAKRCILDWSELPKKEQYKRTAIATFVFLGVFLFLGWCLLELIKLRASLI